MRRTLVISLVMALVPIALMASRATAVTCAPGQEIDLWNKGGAVLRGANVYQGRNVTNADVPFGDGAFSQSDFNDLKAAGANYVHISHAGLFSEAPPYAVDQAAVANLDNVLNMARAAGLYAGIAFRTGPGRNDLSIVDSTNKKANSDVFVNQAAQDAWVQMVRFAADRYKSDPIVVGLSVMVEPTAYTLHDFIDPAPFYQQYGGTIEDVNGLYARATAAIRSVDPTTPILLEPEGHGNISWLPFLKITGDQRTVYTPHDYEPFKFTHGGKGKYPSKKNNRQTLEAQLAPVTAFGQRNNVPVAITEFGARSKAKTAGAYIADRASIQEKVGNYIIWTWQPAGFKDKFSAHNPGRVQDAIKAAWAANCTRA